jgi:hypothetical protein
MLGPVLAIFLLLILVGVVRAAGELRDGQWFGPIVIVGFVLRLIIQTFIRDVQLFSHELGGDSFLYEAWGQLIAVIWRHNGIHFVTSDELPELGPTTLPSNIFALVIYLNDGPTRLGCTALVALAAALTVLNVYKLALQFGALPRQAMLVGTLLYFDPALLHYSSDMYKDALVVCFVFGALASSIRLTFRFSLLHALIGIACVYALWFVRFYLVFVTVAPLLVGVLGIGSRSLVRPFVASLLMVVAALALSGYTDLLQLASERASFTFQVGTSTEVKEANLSTGGSGVAFDDGGSPYGALLPKLAYTLFSPFLWASGSIGFHIGKIDALIWYYLMYKAARAAPNIDRRLLIAILTFVVPCTIMYAMSMSNVGLIVRQRLVIVVAVAVVAALARPRETVALPEGLRASRAS